jgi:hypothetical protein
MTDVEASNLVAISSSNKLRKNALQGDLSGGLMIRLRVVVNLFTGTGYCVDLDRFAVAGQTLSRVWP